MTPDEIDESTDVSALFTSLKAAREDGRHDQVRRIEARMRDLAGHNTKSDDRRGRAVAADPAAIARIRSDGEGGGSA